MKKKFLVLILLLITPTLVNAQATINTSFDDENCVLTVSGTQTGHDATVSIFNKDNELMGFKTGEIENNNYSIDFVLAYSEDQKINITLSNEDGTNEFSKDNISIPACELSTDKKYVVSDENDNSISFTEEAGHTYTLTIFDFVGLTDEELVASEISKADYEAALTGITDATKENGTLISFFKIEIKDEHDNKVTNGPLKLKIKITEEMKKYDTFKMIYVDTDNNFNTEDPIIFTVNGDYLEGTLNHLSTYALVGTNTPTENNIKTNPKTGDNIMFNVSMLGLSAIGLIGLGIYLKKGKKI